MGETPNLLRTAPIRRRTDKGLTAFIIEHADDLRARREQGERAEDILPLVEQRFGRPIKLVTFASLLSRLVPRKPAKERPSLRYEPPTEKQIKKAPRQPPDHRAREPPAPAAGEPDRHSGTNHTEQPGISRPIKAKIFLPKQSG
jgi:hypothetical protein